MELAISKRTMRFYRGISGAVLTVFLLPFAGIIYLLVTLYAGVVLTLSKLQDLAVDLWRSLSDPGYYRLGCFDYMARCEIMKNASDCWRKGDKQEAIANWRHAARLYDNHAMFQLAKCHESGDGLEKDFSKAYELYLLADIYHNEKAEAECKRLEQYAMNRRERESFRDAIWSRN